jgi:hypothetical protein
MEVFNDNSCSWINDLSPRSNIKIIKKNEECDWLIVGAGYTGLSAARKLGQLYPQKKIANTNTKNKLKTRDIFVFFFKSFIKIHYNMQLFCHCTIN